MPERSGPLPGGLSPRIRGNPRLALERLGDFRSIPAYTGEPVMVKHSLSEKTVYPRVYGGTSCLSHWPVKDSGLSPRIRGNHVHEGPLRRGDGSIPAYTGEPSVEPQAHGGFRVYPRVYGGTVCFSRMSIPNGGLSPRIRGNRDLRLRRRVGRRSIPAYTGEPHRDRGSGSDGGVYPRVYGGTPSLSGDHSAKNGLSPRIRGNRPYSDAVGRLLRSIPAYTGEPWRSASRGLAA